MPHFKFNIFVIKWGFCLQICCGYNICISLSLHYITSFFIYIVLCCYPRASNIFKNAWSDSKVQMLYRFLSVAGVVFICEIYFVTKVIYQPWCLLAMEIFNSPLFQPNSARGDRKYYIYVVCIFYIDSKISKQLGIFSDGLENFLTIKEQSQNYSFT